MSIWSLSKRLIRAAREQGRSFWADLEAEWREVEPHWQKLKQQLQRHRRQLRRQLAFEIRRWLEEDLGIPWTQWRSALWRDPEIERAYQILNLPYGTEMAIVKQRWLTLLKQHHPDRHMSSPQKQAIATHTSQMLTAAYHQIAKAFDDGRI